MVLLFLRAGLNGIAIACDLDTGTNGRMVWRPVVGALSGFPFVPALVTELRAVELLRADGDPICSNQSTIKHTMKRVRSTVMQASSPIFGCCDRVRVLCSCCIL